MVLKRVRKLLHETGTMSEIDFWFSRPLGREVVAAEIKGLSSFLKVARGSYAIQCGGPVWANYITSAPTAYTVYMSPDSVSYVHSASIQAQFVDLPLQMNSVDMMVLAHVLEFSKRPQKILSETYHVLAPGGSVAVIGFNPWSLFGWCRFFISHLRFANHTYMSMRRVRRTLRSVGFEVFEYKTFFFRPPLTTKNSLQKTIFMEAIGQMLWSFFGATYIVFAKKSFMAVTPIRESLWRRFMTLNRSYAPKPTTFRSEL